jgi:two-component system sensor histidine kinase NreB
VYDDGKGFDVADLAAVSGVGITGMRERASLVGGLIEIRSALSQGTRVVLRVPLSNEGREDAS